MPDSRPSTPRRARPKGLRPFGNPGRKEVKPQGVSALAIRKLAIKRGRIGHLSIEDLEVGRLRVRELVVEQEQTPEKSAA